MKMLTKWAALALASASLSAVMALPASAGPVKNCNNPSSEKTVTSKCVTDTNDVGNHKISKENWADEQDRIHSIAASSNFGKTTTWSTTAVDHNNGHILQYNRYSDGSGDMRDFNPNTGVTSYTVRNANGTFSTVSSHAGAGGSGGAGRGAAR